MGSTSETMQSVAKLRATLAKAPNRQVRSTGERELARAVATSWFRNAKVKLSAFQPTEFETADTIFGHVLQFTESSTTREHYLSALQTLKSELAKLRTRLVAGELPRAETFETLANAPEFSPLVADEAMRKILIRRWDETRRCLKGQAHLAATVMMGGLLEALLLARLNRLSDKGPAFRSAAAPKDKAGKTLPLKEWSLRDYIDVAHELSWIGQSAKDVSVVLRDWRNYIHPAKELSHGVVIDGRETTLLSAVFVSIVRQLLV